MRIDQIVIGASVGDAVTESARLLQRTLAPRVGGGLYALHREDRLAREVERMERFPAARTRSKDDVIVYHASIGDDRFTDFLAHRPERVIVVYHNITPARFFREFDSEFATLLETGRRSLPGLLDRCDAVIAHSEFSAQEIRSLGRNDVIVSPPALNIGRLRPDRSSGFDDTIAARVPGRMLLAVGQVLPHKRPDLLAAAHHYLVTNVDPTATLVIAGPMRNRRYADAFQRFVRWLRLDRVVWMTGHIDDHQLASLYQRADVLLTASEHEGFCVPVAEAFHFGVPVIARGFGAIPETVGDGGLVLPASTGVVEFVEAIGRVVTDGELHAQLAARSRARRAAFSSEATLTSMVGALVKAFRSIGLVSG